jgi:proteasome inhibitor subunit 1 (PI31)
MSDPTSTSTLQQLVPYLLPERGQPGSTLTAPTDLAAVLVHAIHTSLEFRLIRPATPSGSRNQSADTEEQDDDEGQQRRGEDTEDTVSQALQGQSSSSSLDARFVRLATEARLPSGWNDRGEDSYTFTYKHEQSGLSFIVRVGRMGGRVNVSGMAEVSVRVLQAFVPFVLLRLMLSLLPSE